MKATKLIRTAALGLGDHAVVHVLFSINGSNRAGYYMARETYHAIPLGRDATPEDYAAFGAIVPAPTEFDYGPDKGKVSVDALGELFVLAAATFAACKHAMHTTQDFATDTPADLRSWCRAIRVICAAAIAKATPTPPTPSAIAAGLAAEAHKTP